MKKMFAFTLSEVLVTMSIIGVISALTVPTLINNYQRKTQVVQLRKSINDVVNAIDMYITEEGKTSFKATPLFANLDDFISQKLKVLKTCEAEATGCFANEQYMPVGAGTGTNFECAGQSYVLANSSAICMTKGNDDLISVNIDVNGTEGPNIGGRDMYIFYILPSGEVTYCSNGAATCDGDVGTCTGSAIGEGCTAVLAENNWQMTY